METTTAPLPRKILSRKDEITADFFRLMENHVQELIEGKAGRRLHAFDFGQLLFIHPRHLTNTIKLTTGKSPCDFMEERLLLESQKMLAETDMQIADIALRFGYNDPTNFTKFFKGMCGITPREYRKGWFKV
jgi:AraC family transcriptional regulator of adaptative response / methylphosphotriester-DNA alkyltransferase methyltransferase